MLPNDNIKPPSVDLCDSCYKGVAANHYGLRSSPVEHEIQSPATGGYAYKISGEALQANANQECRWCSHLLEWCKSSFDFKTNEECEVRVGKGAGSQGQHVFSIFVNNRICWFGYIYTKEDDPAAVYIPGRNLYLEIGTKDALLLAQKLMDDCIQNHEECQPPSNPEPMLPTRVIDCSDPDHPHLAIMGSHRRGRYVVLSYVWGDKLSKKLTVDNLEAYKREIPIEDQPQTIQDAILTTHRLGLQYLWIDSLCIIQEGDRDDNTRELQRMASYYKGSYLAIIAASAPKAPAGFLQTRKDNLSDKSLALPFVNPGEGASGIVYLSSWMARMSKYEPEQEPIHSRGWCMQEYFLSPRALVFATPTLQYRCHNGTRNIAGADNSHWISSEREPVPSRDLPREARTTEEKRRIRQAWKLTIENYTKRTISRPTDKLVAIAALVEELHSILRTPYYAGLWERTLLFDLLWSKEYAKHHNKRPAAYRAPSWSWASLDGEINPGNAYFSDKENLVAEVKRCETTLKNPQLPFGEVTAATLVLKAKVISRCIMRPDWAIFQLTGKGEPGQDKKEEIGQGKLDSADDSIQSGVLQVWVVVIYNQDNILDPGTRIVQGLLVRPVSPENLVDTEPKYRRVGFFERIDKTKIIEEWLENKERAEIELV